MTEPTSDAVRYRVVYSERVREGLKTLAARAKERGLGPQFRDALQKIDKLLHVYPQYGEPLRDLILKPARLWVLTVPPLVVRYVLDEERRLVMVPTPIKTLKHSGL